MEQPIKEEVILIHLSSMVKTPTYVMLTMSLLMETVLIKMAVVGLWLYLQWIIMLEPSNLSLQITS